MRKLGCGSLQRLRQSEPDKKVDHPRPYDGPTAATPAHYEVDIKEILTARATHGVTVEINANPWRLDLDWRWHERALERGCMMSINPDASTDEIDLTHWGVVMARKGGVPKERVLNCLNLPRFAAFLAERLRRAANGHAPLTKPGEARPLATARGPKGDARQKRDTRREGVEQISQ